jgi:hypothetical protein
MFDVFHKVVSRWRLPAMHSFVTKANDGKDDASQQESDLPIHRPTLPLDGAEDDEIGKEPHAVRVLARLLQRSL